MAIGDVYSRREALQLDAPGLFTQTHAHEHDERTLPRLLLLVVLRCM